MTNYCVSVDAGSTELVGQTCPKPSWQPPRLCVPAWVSVDWALVGLQDGVSTADKACQGWMDIAVVA